MSVRNHVPPLLLTSLSSCLLSYASCFNPDLSQVRFTCSAEAPQCPEGQTCIQGCCGGCGGTNLQNLDFTTTHVPVGVFPDRIAQADFNGDGKLDLAIAYSRASSVGIHLGSGDGTFVAGTPLQIPGSKTLQVTTGDFNRDKKVDLVVTDLAGNALLIYLGFGDGKFAPPQSYPGNMSPYWTTIGDFDRDGNLDIAGIDSAKNSVSPLLLGSGNGAFRASKSTFPTGMGPSGLIAVDLNQDSILDLVTCNFTSNDVSILIGNGDGTFRLEVRAATGQQQNGVVVADFNKDGKLDIATTDGVVSSVTMLFGSGDGTMFAPARSVPVGTHPLGIVVADFDNDGNYDLATANGTSSDVSVLIGKGDGTFQAARNFPVGKGALFLVAGDWNSDGRVDLAVTNDLDNTYSVLLNASK